MPDDQAKVLTHDDRWVAWADDVPGGVTRGETLEEAVENLQDSIRVMLKSTIPRLRAPIVVALLLFCAVWVLPSVHAGGSRVDEVLLELDSVRFSVRQAAIDKLVQSGAPAVRALIAALDDPNRRIARGAAEALGRMRDPRAAGPLIAMLADEDPLVRGVVALALGHLRDPRAVDPLIDMLQEAYPGMARTAALALGEIGDKRAAGPLEKMLSDPDLAMRETAGEALERIADVNVPGCGRIESLIVGLASDDARRKKRVLSALIASQGEAVTSLVTALTDGSPEVRTSAAEALGEIADPRAVEPLIAALARPEASSPDPSEESPAPRMRTRKTVADALGKIGDPRAVEPLIDALLDDDRFVRASAAAALGRIADARAVEPLADAAVTDEYSGVQSAAVAALGEIGDPGGVDALSLIVTDPRHGILHWKAAQALGRIGDPRGADALIDLMEHPDTRFYVRDAAIAALGEVKNPSAVQPLIALIGVQGGPIREDGLLGQAILTLGRIGDPAAVDTLIGLLDEGPQVADQIALGRALAGIDDDRARDRLLDAFEERRTRVIEGGFAFFVAWGARDSEGVLIEILERLNWPQGDSFAAICLQSGNKKLRRAARAWIREHCPKPDYDPAATTAAVPWGSAGNGGTP